MPNDPNKARMDHRQGGTASRLDIEPERERLARLIGRLIAQEWLRTRTIDQDLAPNDLEVTP